MLHPLPLLGTSPDSDASSAFAHAASTASQRAAGALAAPLTDCRKDLQQCSPSDVACEHVTAPTIAPSLSPAPASGGGGVSRPRGATDAGDRAEVHEKTRESRGRDAAVRDDPEALGHATHVSPTRYGTKHTDGPALPRDRAALRRIVDAKYLSAAQLQQFFRLASVTPIRRCLGRLEREGWIRMWEAWVPVGGRTKYALPERKALRWALDRKRAEAIGTPLELLSWTLIGRRSQKPVAFRPRTIPPFLTHQVRTNDVVLALQEVDVPKVLWATSWDRPLPPQLGTFVPPQPDAVLAMERDDLPWIVFLEMDRSTQKIADFVRGKSRNARFARRPELLNETFGTCRFQTLVVVDAETPDAARARTELLMRAARANKFDAVATFVTFDAVRRNPAGTLQLMIAAIVARAEAGSRPFAATLARKDARIA